MKSVYFAAIDIGSYETAIKIVEMDKEKIIIIDEAKKIISLGKDTFTDGKISQSSMEELCFILDGFKKIMKQYQIENFKIIGTSAFREASNQIFIREQIERRIGLQIEIISNEEEKYLMFKAAKDKVLTNKSLNIDKNQLIFLNIGYGNVQMSILDEVGLIYNEGFKIGSLRIKELLGKLERETLNFSALVQAYIASFVEDIYCLQSEGKLKQLIVYGREIEIVQQILGDKQITNRDKLVDIIDELSNLTSTEISKRYLINPSKAELIVPTILLIERFFDINNCENINFPAITLRDGLIKEYHDQKILKLDNSTQGEDLITYSRKLAEKYKYPEKHSKYVENIALKLFDKLKKWQLGGRDRILLQMAAILHDVGKFINVNNHYENGYGIIMATDIPGLSEEEHKLVALIAKYHGKLLPENDKYFHRLTPDMKIRVSKLSAILNIANTIDYSHRQILKDITIKRKGECIIIHGAIKEEALLESWMFEKTKSFFLNVYGIDLKLEIDRI